MKTKFTEGEWKAVIFEDGASVDVGSFEIINIENTAIDRDYGEKGFNHWSESDTVHIDIPMSEQHGNAHLIAAAPDMYEFIQSLISYDMLNGTDADEAITLLLKARGE